MEVFRIYYSKSLGYKAVLLSFDSTTFSISSRQFCSTEIYVNHANNIPNNMSTWKSDPRVGLLCKNVSKQCQKWQQCKNGNLQLEQSLWTWASVCAGFVTCVGTFLTSWLSVKVGVIIHFNATPFKVCKGLAGIGLEWCSWALFWHWFSLQGESWS